MKQAKARWFLPVLLVIATSLAAQERNSVPLDHAAYDIIEMGVMRGVISPPPSARPWAEEVVKDKLWEIINYPAQVLTTREVNAATLALDSLEREAGLDLGRGRYRVEGGGFTVEAGLGWESGFSIEAPGASIASVNVAKLYAGGDIEDFASWNITLLGEFLYIGQGNHNVSPFFPCSYSKQWDGGVLSLRGPGGYSAWPVDPSLAGGFLAELNGVFFDQRLHLRLGRVRHDWGPGSNGASLFINAHARPFAAIEGTYSPLSWLGVSFLNGALEYFREDGQPPGGGPFTNMLSAVQVEFNPVKYVYFSLGGSAVWFRQVNPAAFSSLELRLPGLLKIWGSLFVDRLGSFSENFSVMNSNSYAWQAGFKTVIHWLPFAAFILRYTKVEPYCYANTYNGGGGESFSSSSAFASGGESLGYYMPPNSDELLVRMESRLLPELEAHIQFQMMRRGADYGYGRVPGSSLRDTLTDTGSAKYFLKDGVYRWDNVIKLGASCNVKIGAVPLAAYAEAGVVLTSFTINGSAGPGKEAEYESLDDSVYRARNGFVFSVGFRLFP
ncbi:MAG: hypothetical protein LBQ69_05805 [Treponema sp.]|jgi:hypothetical protein|nr:hypothetical protein [Treponema sp.]